MPTVAIVGRPNVGKSTLFNRLLGRRLAVVDDRPGITRDRNYGHAVWRERRFLLVDTGGYVPRAAAGMETLVRQQAELAIEEAELVLLVLDVQTGVTDLDAEIARMLLKRGALAVPVVNKVDTEREAQAAAEFYRLGLGDPLAISAAHGRAVGDLLDLVVARLPEAEAAVEEMAATRVAIVGRPNVGKSSLVNALLGEERMIVHEAPGTTRDAVDSHVEWGGQRFVLVDTAGLRRAGRVADEAEFYSTLRSVQALERADVAAVVMDASDPFTRQDVRVVGAALEAARPVLLVLNKWDLVDASSGSAEHALREAREFHLPFLPGAPMLFVSARTGRRVAEILVRAAALAEEFARTIPTASLNASLRRLVERRQPPATAGGRHARIFYATQTGRRPPVVTLFVSRPEAIPPHYVRYLENQLRDEYQFTGTPLLVKLRPRRRARGEALEEIG